MRKCSAIARVAARAPMKPRSPRQSIMSMWVLTQRTPGRRRFPNAETAAYSAASSTASLSAMRFQGGTNTGTDRGTPASSRSTSKRSRAEAISRRARSAGKVSGNSDFRSPGCARLTCLTPCCHTAMPGLVSVAAKDSSARSGMAAKTSGAHAWPAVSASRASSGVCLQASSSRHHPSLLNGRQRNLD